MLRIWVSRRTFSFLDNSSCRWECSLRDSFYPGCASCNSNLWAWACCWSSLIQLLRDPAGCSCFISSDLAWLSKWPLFPSRRQFPTFTGSANLKTWWTLLSKQFPDSLLRFLSENVFWLTVWHENIASRFPATSRSREELVIKPSRLEWWARACPSFSSRSRIYSGEASISRKCSSSRSESGGVAMLPAES